MRVCLARRQKEWDEKNRQESLSTFTDGKTIESDGIIQLLKDSTESDWRVIRSDYSSRQERSRLLYDISLFLPFFLKKKPFLKKYPKGIEM
ncbi:hypothetical protein AVEN_27351-1 [Araneus ventricosus]|uniref:Uncharacterized protein n=1 Tax=Araneus ventricosus TaxID=182803 RepID=A0A4Y2P5X5_ARAVE|nr:hypothetical protein AVEN_27351-1 [Araneus ventricosus]